MISVKEIEEELEETVQQKREFSEYIRKKRGRMIGGLDIMTELVIYENLRAYRRYRHLRNQLGLTTTNI